MNFVPSMGFQAFHDHVFGDYRYFYHNGLSESLFTALDETDRKEAERLVLRAVRWGIADERVIRAAGWLRLQDAVPYLKRRLGFWRFLLRKDTRAAIAWALLKIRANEEDLLGIIDVAKGGCKIPGLKRTDAIELLGDYRTKPLILKTLLDLVGNREFLVGAYAVRMLQKLLRDDEHASRLLSHLEFNPAPWDVNSLAHYLKRYIDE